MMRRLVRSSVLVLVVGALASAVGCSESTAPSFNPIVTNQTDDFQLQASGVAGITEERVYTWQNTGTQARVTHTTMTQLGLARVVIMDGSGTTVYDANLVPSGTVDTPAGVAGTWTIELILTGFSGNLNFRLQKL